MTQTEIEKLAEEIYIKEWEEFYGTKYGEGHAPAYALRAMKEFAAYNADGFMTAAKDGKIDLNNLEKKLNDALGKETTESLTKWLKDQRKGFAINETVILDKGFANESKVLYVGETPNGLISSVCDGGHTWEVMSYRLTKEDKGVVQDGKIDAETILNKHYNAKEGFTGYEISCIVAAMKEYAGLKNEKVVTWDLLRDKKEDKGVPHDDRKEIWLNWDELEEEFNGNASKTDNVFKWLKDHPMFGKSNYVKGVINQFTEIQGEESNLK